MELQLKVIPRSSQNKLVQFCNETLKVKIMTPPVDGKANEKVINFLSEEFKIKKSKIEILLGRNSRIKRIHLRVNEAEKNTLQNS